MKLEECSMNNANGRLNAMLKEDPSGRDEFFPLKVETP